MQLVKCKSIHQTYDPQILYFIHLDLPSSGIPSQSLSPWQSTPNSFDASPATSPCNSLQYMDTKGFFTTLLDPCGSKLQISLGTFVQIGTDFNFGTNLVLVLQRLYGCSSQLCNQRDCNKYSGILKASLVFFIPF